MISSMKWIQLVNGKLVRSNETIGLSLTYVIKVKHIVVKEIRYFVSNDIFLKRV